MTGEAQDLGGTDAVPPPRHAKGTMRGGHDPRELAKRSAEVRRQRKQDGEVLRRSGGDGLGMALGESEAVLLAILRDKESLDTSKVAAARALQSLRESQALKSPESEVWTARQRTLEQLPVADRLAFLKEAVAAEGVA